jgi:hypothetical protein
MKKKKTQTKLVLRKDTLKDLSARELEGAVGGNGDVCPTHPVSGCPSHDAI